MAGLRRRDARLARAPRRDRARRGGAATGYVFATGGDGFGVAFGSATDAIRCAVAVQRALKVKDWGAGPSLRVRMELHTGRAQESGDDDFGGDVSTAARVMAVAHGGQIVTSRPAADLAPGVDLRDLGEHHLRDIDGAHRLCCDLKPKSTKGSEGRLRIPLSDALINQPPDVCVKQNTTFSASAGAKTVRNSTTDHPSGR